MKTGKLYRNFLCAIAIFFVVFGFARLYFKLTDDFRIANITYKVPYNPDWEIPSPNTEEKAVLEKVLNQPYHYLGKGAQCYAFASEDEEYVIKFFKFKHHKPTLLGKALLKIPFTKKYQMDRDAKHKRKLDSAYQGYMLAFKENKKETGLVTMHLNRTDHLKKKLRVTDKVGFSREIELDPVVYVIQKKAKVTQEIMKEALAKGDVAFVKDHMGKIFDLYISEYRKGVYDRDHCIMKNTGFAGADPIHFDVGKFSKDDCIKNTEAQKEDLNCYLVKIKQWFKVNRLEHYAEVESHWKEMIKNRV